MCPGQRAAVGLALGHLEQLRRGRSSANRYRLLASYSLLSRHAPRGSRLSEVGTLKAQMGAHRWCTRLFQPRIKRGLEVRHSDVRWRAHMQVRMESSARVVRHQNFHLTFRQVLDVLVERARFGGLNIDRAACLLISLVSEELPTLPGQAA